MSNFSDALREAMEIQELTQKELRLRIGMSEKQMSYLYNGKVHPRVDTVVKIGKALQLDPFKLHRLVSIDMVAEVLDIDAGLEDVMKRTGYAPTS